MKTLTLALAFLVVPLTARADCQFVRTWQCQNGFCTWQEVWQCLPTCRRECAWVTDGFGVTRWICREVCR